MLRLVLHQFQHIVKHNAINPKFIPIRYYSNFDTGFGNKFDFEMKNDKRKIIDESEEDVSSHEEEVVKKSKEDDDISFAKNDEGEYYMDLPGSKKRVTVRTFKGNTYIDFREFYTTKDGKQAPGKKGISLKIDEWNAVKAHIDDIEKSIKALK